MFHNMQYIILYNLKETWYEISKNKHVETGFCSYVYNHLLTKNGLIYKQTLVTMPDENIASYH